MRLASISLVKDEADILEAFVRHNLHFVDRMYIVDDRSSDNTPEILRRLADENPDVRILDDGWVGPFHQSRRTTAVLNRIKSDDDWDAILALDADEMICAADRATFESDIAAIPPESVGGLSELLYFAAASDDTSIVDPLTRIRTAHAEPGKLPKSFAVRAVLGEAGLTFTDGNHAVSVEGRDLPIHYLPNTVLAHFAIRSADQVAIKCLKHYVGWRSRLDYAPSLSSHLIKGAQALMTEPGFGLRPSSAIVGTYLGFDAAKGKQRPFLERRGALKWPELAAVTPYVQLLGLLDHLIAQARQVEIMKQERDNPPPPPPPEPPPPPSAPPQRKRSFGAFAAKMKRSYHKRFG